MLYVYVYMYVCTLISPTYHIYLQYASVSLNDMATNRQLRTTVCGQVDESLLITRCHI